RDAMEKCGIPRAGEIGVRTIEHQRKRLETSRPLVPSDRVKAILEDAEPAVIVARPVGLSQCELDDLRRGLADSGPQQFRLEGCTRPSAPACRSVSGSACSR